MAQLCDAVEKRDALFNQSDLFGDLSKIINEPDGGRLLQWVINVVNIHLSLIEQVMKHIDCFYSWWTLLLVAKNEVNPLMKVSWDVFALQRLQSWWNTIQMSTHCHWETPLARLGVFLTSLWTLINSRGSPFAQDGRMTSASLVPFCLAPERPR